MGRSGYSDDCDNLDLWRGAVNSAIKGKRGQAFLREMLAALDAMPEKRLISGELVCDDGVCAMGAVAQARQLDVGRIDPCDQEQVSKAFGIARAMAAEISYVNDEESWYHETPEGRFQRVRKWVANRLGGK